MGKRKSMDWLVNLKKMVLFNGWIKMIVYGAYFKKAVII